MSELLFRPEGDAPAPAIVIGAEATGINTFIRRVGTQLAEHGFVAIVPDFYRGDGPPDPEAYDDIDTLMPFIERLDFDQATGDLLAAADHLRAQPFVDPTRIATWGYCTGATLALLAAERDPDISATVLFYPSQPDLPSWSPAARMLLVYGEDDVVMPTEQLAELRRRLEANGGDHRVVTYPGAGHAFCAEVPMFFNEHACEDGWQQALAFAKDWASGVL